MRKSNTSKILKKYTAITIIYLIISLTFLTAKAMAVLNYDISGENGVSGFAKAEGDNIRINVVADSNVSFITGSGKEIKLGKCSGTETPGGISCYYNFKSADIQTYAGNVPFTLKQIDGTPLTTKGNLIVDGIAPVNTTLVVTKIGENLRIVYNFSDYLASTTETFDGNNCLGSGIGHIEFSVQGKIYAEEFTSKNCTVAGEKLISLSSIGLVDTLTYTIIVRDRVGNEFNTNPVLMEGDFKAPIIAEKFRILQGNSELTSVSSSAQITANIEVQVEDANLFQLEADLTNLNSNPAINMDPMLKHVRANCIKESSTSNICTFTNVLLQPKNNDISIKFNATDFSGNLASKEVGMTINLKDDAGSVSYLGPQRTQCTADLEKCYVQNGVQFFQAELSTTSSFNHSIIHLGINGEDKSAFCKLDGVWKCTGMYTVSPGTNVVELVVAESYDDYGNLVQSTLEREILVDDEKPKDISVLTAVNSNNNADCAVAGDTLNFNIKVTDASPELRMYLDSSGFTTQKIQKGICTQIADGWDCNMVVKDFSSVPTTVTQNITIEDLAGNPLRIPYTFNVCKASSNTVPNTIFDVTQGPESEWPTVDRRTASKISVKTFIPVEFDVQTGATLMYLNVERCVATGMNGADVLGTGHTFMPNYGIKPLLAVYIGHNLATLPEDKLEINCTISARVKVGPTVFLQDEREEVTLYVHTINNPMGIIDDATTDEMNEVGEHLVELDSKIKKWESTFNWLGTVCSLAESIGAINSVLQAVKSVVYIALRTIYTVFHPCEVTTPYCLAITTSMRTAWIAIQTHVGGLHGFITKWIWPPGIVPGKGVGISFGNALKWLCMLYTCKHYDVGTYWQIANDLGTRMDTPTDTGYTTDENGVTRDANDNPIDEKGRLIELEPDGKTQLKTDAGATPVNNPKNPPRSGILVYKDSNGNLIDSEGRFILDNGQYARYVGDGMVAIDDPSIIPPVKTESDTIGKPFEFRYSGRSDDGSKFGKGQVAMVDTEGKSLGIIDEENNPIQFKNYERYTVNVATQNSMLIDALNGHKWVVNPYRSIHYDTLCIPAYIYNLKKERQISCMYLRCLQNQEDLASPMVRCQGNYKVNKCLYLDSAQYVLAGESVWKTWFESFGDSFISGGIGFTIGLGYRRFCKDDYVPGGALKALNLGDGKALQSVVCGVSGSVFALREILDAVKNPYALVPKLNINSPDGSSEEVDYCKGLNYATTYNAPSERDSGEWYSEE